MTLDIFAARLSRAAHSEILRLCCFEYAPHDNLFGIINVTFSDDHQACAPPSNTRRSISRLPPQFRQAPTLTRPFPCVWLAPRPPRPRSSVAPALEFSCWRPRQPWSPVDRAAFPCPGARRPWLNASLVGHTPRRGPTKTSHESPPRARPPPSSPFVATIPPRRRVAPSPRRRVPRAPSPRPRRIRLQIRMRLARRTRRRISHAARDDGDEGGRLGSPGRSATRLPRARG